MNKRPQLQNKANPPKPQMKFPLLMVTCQNRQELIHQIGSINSDKTWSQIKSLINIVFGFNQSDSLQYIYKDQQDDIFIMIDADYQQFCQFMKERKYATLTILNENKLNQSKQKEKLQKLETKIKEIKVDSFQQNGLKQNYNYQKNYSNSSKNRNPVQQNIKKNKINEKIQEVINYPSLKVNYLDQPNNIPQYGYITSNFKQLKVKILQKLKLNTQHEQIPYLKYKYWSSQSQDFQEIRDQNDFKIFQKTIKSQEQTQIYLYQDYSEISQRQDYLIQKQQKEEKLKYKKNANKGIENQKVQQKQQNFFGNLLSPLFDFVFQEFNQQSKHQNNHKKQDKKQYQDPYRLKCRICQKIKIGKKFICILCQQKEEIYCQLCKDKRQDPQSHPLKKLQKGEQRQIFYFRDSINFQKRTLKQNKNSQTPLVQNKPAQFQQIQFFLLKNMENMKQSKVFKCLKSNFLNEKNILPNTLNITSNDPNNMNKLKSNINTIISLKDLDQAKNDFIKFIQNQNKNQDIQKLKSELVQDNMIRLYSKERMIYKNVNLALKQLQISTNALNIAYFRYPIHQIYKQIQKHYMQEIIQMNPFYMEEFTAYHGGIITQKQFQTYYVGYTLQILGFLSTSRKLSVSKDNFKYNFLIQIVKPENKKLISNDGFCFLNYHQKAFYIDEQQILFNVNSKFQVLSKKKQIDQNGKTMYKLKLKYLQLPQTITKDNFQQIKSRFQILNQTEINKIMVNLQHLDLINRNQMNQGKCLHLQQDLQNSKLFFYYKKNLLIQKIKWTKAQLQSIISMDYEKQLVKNLQQFTICLAQTYNNIGILFKEYKNKFIFRVFTEKALIIINQIQIKYLVTKANYVRNEIILTHYSPMMPFFEINKKDQQASKSLKYNISQNKLFSQLVFSLSTNALDSQKSQIIFKKCLNFIIQNGRIYNNDENKDNFFIGNIIKFVCFGLECEKRVIQQKYKQKQEILQGINRLTLIYHYFKNFQGYQKRLGDYQMNFIYHQMEMQKCVLLLEKQLQILLKSKHQYLPQIFKIYKFLAIMYHYEQSYQKANNYLQASQNLLDESFLTQTYLSSQLKEIQASFNLAKLKNAYLLNIDKNYIDFELQKYKKIANESYQLKLSLWGQKNIEISKSLIFKAFCNGLQKNYKQAIKLCHEVQNIFQISQNTDNQLCFSVVNFLFQLHRNLEQHEQAKKYEKQKRKMQIQRAASESQQQYMLSMGQKLLGKQLFQLFLEQQ